MGERLKRGETKTRSETKTVRLNPGTRLGTITPHQPVLEVVSIFAAPPDVACVAKAKRPQKPKAREGER
jgi:hypothetical protein